ncbi:DUF805 domain-containing protein [Labrys okinawensis]|uniref:DUF805 domain-containing protein n=1 Tax=Labrys okinawensis TaxID=346911 RepID=UPI0011B1E70E|nr:DUF805 domain-containing protein [Labrys okinawensis]
MALGLELVFGQAAASMLIALPDRFGLPESLIYLILVPGLSRLLACLPLLWPLWAVSTKRLHDLGYSGWWLLPVPFAPSSVLWFWVTALLAVRDGVAGPNRYGPALEASADEQMLELFS